MVVLYEGREVRISRGHEDLEARGQIGRIVKLGHSESPRFHVVQLASGREVVCAEYMLSRV
jgi:hypothetical protein